MLGAGPHERGLALQELDLLALDFERARSREDDIDLVVLVRLLAVGLRRDEDVDSDLEPRRRVDDLVAAVLGQEPALGGLDLEPVPGRRAQTVAFLNSGMISPP